MFGLGTIVNTLAVIAGGIIGLFLKNGLKQRFQDTIIQGLGLATLFIGAAGAFSEMLKLVDGSLETNGSLMLILSMVLGGILGEAINIELQIERFGQYLKNKVNSHDSQFVDAFVSTSLVICVGAMAIVGSFQDGLFGDASTLISKAMLDFMIVMVFASTMGVGTVFSAIPIFVYQGTLTLCASFLAPYFTNAIIANMSFVGSVLIFAVGTNLCFQTRIKVGNLLPAIFMPVILSFWL